MIDWIQGHLVWGSVGEWVGGIATGLAVFVAISQARKSSEAAARETHRFLYAESVQKAVDLLVDLLEEVRSDKRYKQLNHAVTKSMKAAAIVSALYDATNSENGSLTLTRDWYLNDDADHIGIPYDAMIQEISMALDHYMSKDGGLLGVKPGDNHQSSDGWHIWRLHIAWREDKAH